MIQVLESSITWLPEFEEKWLPARTHQSIRVVRTQSKVGLEIGNVIGVVPLNNGESLQIVPKVGPINFLRMLLHSEGLYGELQKNFDEFAKYGESNTLSSAWLAARTLANALTEIDKRSPRFGRQRLSRYGNYVAGKLLPVETATRLLLKSEDPVAYISNERTYDTSENRTLGMAAQVAHSYLQPDDPGRKAAARWSKLHRKNFHPHDLLSVDKALRSRKAGGSRGYYIRALTLAKILLGEAGLSATSGAIEAEGVLLDSAALFENYLRNVLLNSHKKSGIVITKGGGLRNQALYMDGQFELVPDYVFQDKTKILLLADAKYKTPDSKDHYQMMCYMLRYGVKVGAMFGPSFSDETKSIRRVTPDGLTVWEIQLPLTDLDQTESILAGALTRLSAKE